SGGPCKRAGTGAPGPVWKGPMRTAGTVALVTGGASGLGLATVRTLVEAGGQVVILDRPGSAGEDVSHELGERTLFAAADVTSEGEVATAVARAVGRLGALRVAVHCAGVGAGMKDVCQDGTVALAG